jgi:hypothetical protein
MSAGPYIQRTTPLGTCQVSRTTPWKETYMAQTYFCKTETGRDHIQHNILVTEIKSKPCTSNKVVPQKAMLTQIWSYGIQLWGTPSTSNIQILERSQLKALHMIVDAPWYVLNTVIWRDLQIPTVKEEIRRYNFQYSARLSTYPNDLVVNLMEHPDNRRLRSHLPNDVPTRFLV